MARFDPRKIVEEERRLGFEKAWEGSGKYLPKGECKLELIEAEGRPHPVFEVMDKLRRSFLKLGFIEIQNQVIVDEAEVYKQYGPEAAVILDRCYYLATLPRPEIGLSKERCSLIESIGVKLDEGRVDCLQRVLRDYKKGVVSGDDFIEKVAEALKTSEVNATKILREAFPEFLSLRPEASTLTLRSHITSAWFPTLQALRRRGFEPPIKLFSVDFRFRREQSEDKTHLRMHHAASCVVMAEDVNVDYGMKLAKAILKPLNLGEVVFIQKKVTPKYYAPNTDFEGFLKDEGGELVEVAELGLYSPIALAHYDLEYPVLNLGIGVERIAMLLYKQSDVRVLSYPQFYEELKLTDSQLAGMIHVNEKPIHQETGMMISLIVETLLKNADAPSPCEFKAYSGKLLDKEVEVFVYEPDVGVKLIGPAALNEIFVYDGNILGIPPVGMDDAPLVKEARAKGVSTNIRFIDSFASMAASRIEKMVINGEPKEVSIRVRIAKQPSDVNINIGEAARRYVEGRRKKIMVKGPVFIGVKARIV